MRDKLLSKTRVDERSGCWFWTGQVDADGYGRIGHYKELTHRAAYRAFVGDPTGACVLHRCDNRACINPDHLFLGTQKDNLVDMYAKGRANLSGLQKGQRPEVLKKIAAKSNRVAGRFSAINAALAAKDSHN